MKRRRSPQLVSALSRRSVLRSAAVGVAAGVAPIAGRWARASGVQAPRRLVVFFTPHGTLPWLWPPTALPGQAATTRTEFTLGPLLAPLTPWKDQVVLLGGIDQKQLDHQRHGACGHATGRAGALTAAGQRADGLGDGASFDALVARSFADASTDALPRANVYLGIGTPSGDPTSAASPFHAGAGQVIPVMNQPREAFDRLFANFQRRDNHDVRALRARVDGASARLSFTTSADLTSSLVAAAFVHDRARVVGVQCHEPLAAELGYEPGQHGARDVHDLLHRMNVDRRTENDPNRLRVAERLFTTYARAFAGLVGKLAGARDRDGARLLDNTLVLWASDVAQPSHSYHNNLWVMAGGAGGHIKTGQFFNWGLDRAAWDGTRADVPSNSDLFATLADVWTLPANSAARAGTPIAGLLA